eukprot:359945-Chlamydomonas_euryale.AAC.3
MSRYAPPKPTVSTHVPIRPSQTHTRSALWPCPRTRCLRADYGRCGEDSCNYYGRKYDVATTAFSQSHLVDDNDYIKVGASMAGVHSLRTRPGLSLDASVISGPSARLEKLSPYTVGSARGVHKVTAHARLRGTERPAWVN